MILIIKVYGALCLFVCLLFLFEHLIEFYGGKSTSASLLTFLGILYGAGGGFLFAYAKYLIDTDGDGVSDEIKKEVKR